MKHLTKILALAIVFCMLLSVGVVSFAASGEPSGEASAEPAEETVTIGEYTFTVYAFDGVQYVRLADLAEVLDTAEEEPAAEEDKDGEEAEENK